MTSTPFWAQANGEVERQNRSLLKAINIAQLEKKDWKREMLTFLLAYRSTPHSTTGVSPAELLFRRKIRTKLPELREEGARPDMIEVQDRDSEMKQKGADYANVRRRAQRSDIQSRDKVLVKKKKVDKLSPTFYEVPMEVVEKRGGDVTVKSSTGSPYRRNVTHLKKFEDEPSEVEQSVQENENQVDENVQDQNQDLELTTRENIKDGDNVVSSRPQRVRRAPERFKDYICSSIHA